MGIPGSPRFGQTGVIELGSLAGCTEPECITPYNGDHRFDTAYLVGWNTEHEKLFRGDRTNARRAVAYANANGRLRTDRILLTELPLRAVRELLEG